MEIESVSNAGSLSGIQQAAEQAKGILELGQELKKVEAAEEGVKNLESSGEEEEVKEEDGSSVIDALQGGGSGEDSGTVFDVLA